MNPSARSPRAFVRTGAFSALVNLYGFVDEHTFVTKTGDLGVVLAVNGVDDECLDADGRDRVARRFEAALRTLAEDTRLLQYIIKRPRGAERPTPHPDSCVRALFDAHQRFREERRGDVYDINLYWVVIASPGGDAGTTREQARAFTREPVAFIREWFSHDRTVTALGDAIARRHEALHRQVQAFMTQLEDVVRPTVLSKRAAFRVFRRLLNYEPQKADAIELREDTFLDYHVCDSVLECHRGHLRLDDAYARVMTLREPPRQTFAHVLSGLVEIPSALVLMSEWRRVDAATMRRRLRGMQRHFHNARIRLTHYLTDEPTVPGEALVDDSATALVHELGACLTDLTVHGRFVGAYSLTLVLSDDDPARLAEHVATAFKACATHDGQLTDERPNLLNAWLAVVPGNAAYNLRTMFLLNTNAADLAFLFAPARGEPRNGHLAGESLAVLGTTTRTPYHLNLHVGDVGHALVLGATGSGKSFLLNFLVARLQQYGGRTTIFDLGGGYERLTAYFGGAMLRVARDRRTVTINPFCLPLTPANRQFLWRFLKVLIQSDEQYAMTEADDRDLYEQLETLYALDRDQRRLFTLATILRRPLGQQLQRWVEGGQYAEAFDHVEDTVTLARFQSIDVEGLDLVPQVLEPTLFYLLYRADLAMQEPADRGALKVFVIDEAWRFFRDPAIRAYVTEALKTWRKRNACVLLATQSSEDLMRTELLRVVLESCPTMCFLANSQIDRGLYREVFHLTETEAERITTLRPRHEFLLKQPGVAKVLALEVDPDSARLFGAAHARDRPGDEPDAPGVAVKSVGSVSEGAGA